MIFLVAFILLGCSPSTEIQPIATPSPYPTPNIVSTATTEPTPEATPMVIPEGSFRGFWEPELVTYDWQWNEEKHGDGNQYNGYYYYLHKHLYSFANLL